MSRGRVAWNIVTTAVEAAAANFGRSTLVEHDKRYEIAEEFVDVVRGLWDTWEPGAVIADKATGQFLDPSRVHTLDHKGPHFQVKGPLNIERSKYGQPLIIQAGGSAPGQELSARTADLVFSVVNGDKVSAKTAYDGLKARMAKYGRAPDAMKILPGVMPIVGRSDAEAREQLARLQSWLSADNAMQLVASRIGIDISAYPLDTPVSQVPATLGEHQAFARTLLEMAMPREDDAARPI